MAKEPVTSMDVARLAGVSQSAVSRAYTPGASVSQKTAEKVRRAAAQLGYRPNILARSLTTGRSRIIGLVVANLDNYFYPEAMEKLSAALQALGYHLLVFMVEDQRESVDKVLEDLLAYRVQGIVMASVSMSNTFASNCVAEGIPVVLFNRYQDDRRLSAVSSDNYRGALALAEFLLAGGHRKIGHIAGAPGASTQRDREAGFLQALEAHGLDWHCREVGHFRYDQAQAAAREIFSATDWPDALFVASDHMAFAIMDTLRHEFSIRIPEEVSIVGFDDVPLAAWPSFDLTTVRQQADKMVEAVVQLLQAQIDKEQTPARRITVGTQLVVRGSARLPP